MSPSAIPVDSHPPQDADVPADLDTPENANVPVNSDNPQDISATKSRNTEPLKKSGALDAAFEFDDVTPNIGREYLTTQIVEDILNAPNADDLLRDLAITSKYFAP
jgi:hypothetical protein